MTEELKKALRDLRQMECVCAGSTIEWWDGEQSRYYCLTSTDIDSEPRWIEVIA
jgi:hypothetical protein